MKITEEQIKDLDNGSTTVRELFPQVFETVLEVGEWYKQKNANVLILRSGEFGNFGFYNKTCGNNLHCITPSEWQKADIEEVKQRMTEELVKRGFVKGCSFVSLGGYIRKNTSGVLGFDEFIKEYDWIICIGGYTVFENGQFATLINEPTQKEILQAKIKELQQEIDKL